MCLSDFQSIGPFADSDGLLQSCVCTERVNSFAFGYQLLVDSEFDFFAIGFGAFYLAKGGTDLIP